jgi:choline dehydrogenase-like flavoprotein
LLLNSKSKLFPEGLANSSGTVGRYLMDSVGSSGWGYVPQMEQMPPHNHDGTGGMHMYIPWWKYDKKNDFPRGYHIEIGGGRDMPSVGMFDDVCDDFEGYGTELKRTCRKKYGTGIAFAGRGEMVPNPDTYCEIDPTIVDQFGIPVLKFHFKWTDYELRQAKDMQDTFKSIVETMGGEYRTKTPIDGPNAFGIEEGGKIIHEVGTVRMGGDPKTSVLNGYCQAHDMKNLFVTDGAPLVTNPDKNPTLTIMALSWRASDYLLEQAKNGSI